MRKALVLFWKDLKKSWYVLAGIAVYLLLRRYLLHETCPFVLLSGFPCPFCGMTRAGFALLHGSFGLAWTLHPFIYVALIWLVILALNRYILKKGWKWVKAAAAVTLSMILIFYIYRMIVYFPDHAPMGYYKENLLWHIWQSYFPA